MIPSAEEAETRRREEEKETVVTRLSSDASSGRGSQRLVGLGIVSEELEGHRELEERKQAGFTSVWEPPSSSQSKTLEKSRRWSFRRWSFRSRQAVKPLSLPRRRGDAEQL